MKNDIRNIDVDISDINVDISNINIDVWDMDGDVQNIDDYIRYIDRDVSNMVGYMGNINPWGLFIKQESLDRNQRVCIRAEDTDSQKWQGSSFVM